MSAFQSGDVYSYTYLWKRQHLAGETSGRKARPSALMFRSATTPGELYLFPLTVQTPDPSRQSVLVPAGERRRIGLDRRCWLILDEFNVTLSTRIYDFESIKPLGRFSRSFVKVLAERITIALKEGQVAPVKRS